MFFRRRLTATCHAFDSCGLHILMNDHQAHFHQAQTKVTRGTIHSKCIMCMMISLEDDSAYYNIDVAGVGRGGWVGSRVSLCRVTYEMFDMAENVKCNPRHDRGVSTKHRYCEKYRTVSNAAMNQKSTSMKMWFLLLGIRVS